MKFNLTRPKPKLPNSYFWTCDHSTNWYLEDPGLINFGSWIRNIKQPETYIKDYTRLIDMASDLGVKGIVIWGFLRDSHGGEDFAKKISTYAKSKNVAIMPGIGTTHYGGVYFEGEHKYNMNTFLRDYPEAAAITSKEKGSQRSTNSTCPSSPLYKEWIEESVKWLFDEFDVGGCNIENGDFFSCYCDACQAQKEEISKTDPNFLVFQALSNKPVLDIAKDIVDKDPDLLITWATYCGFVPEKVEDIPDKPESYIKTMGTDKPEVFKALDYEGIAQWTLTKMLRKDEIKLIDFLDDGKAPSIYDNPSWSRDIRPPSQRSTGFVHQGSQWDYSPWETRSTRYDLFIGRIKEACLRSYEAGLEGVSIHGEVSARHIPSALNYLAFSHFIHWPEDNLREFGRKTLGQVFLDEKEGEDFIELLTLWEADKITQRERDLVKARYDNAYDFIKIYRQDETEDKMTKFFFWNWLYKLLSGFHASNEAYY